MAARPRLRWLYRVVGLALGVYALLVLAAFVAQRRLLYLRLPAVELWGDVDRLPGGTPVIRSGPDPGVVWFHGNADQLGTLRPVAEALSRPALFVEYPGYGHSPGRPTEASILAVAREAMGTLEHPACLGHSLGTGVAIAMAAEGRCERLVLISPYTSITEAAQSQYPALPARWLVLDRWESRSRAPAINVPTLILHGEHDPVVPTWMGRELATLIPGARFVLLQGRHHNDLYGPELWGPVLAFLDEP